MKAAVVGIAGPVVSEAERELLRTYPPAGVILFGRNVVDPAQLRDLNAALRSLLPEHAVRMVDQEGGRVARLRPPHWRAHPPAAAIGRVYATDPARAMRVAWLTGALIGTECREAGFDVVTAPVLDRRLPGAHDIIGDRAYSDDPEIVAALGDAMAEGLLAAGVQPLAKHVPGHGRAGVDSHVELPRVAAPDLDADFRPFTTNRNLPWAMVAHVLYIALDPARPASQSSVIVEIIRKRLGFSGVLITDDLAMGALSGELAERAAGALGAGCDLALFCPGEPDGNAAVLAACPDIAPDALARMRAARGLARQKRRDLDADRLAAERGRLLA